MPKFFKKKKKGKKPEVKKEEIPAEYRVKGDLVDPISYVGDLDEKTYPVLPLEVKDRIEEDVENPLNKR